jgi:putative flippase GtrA
MIRHFLTRQFAVFVFVGGTAAFVNWTCRLALGIWFSFSASVVLAYLVGMATAFLLNRIFVFGESDRPISKQARDFVAINLFFMPIVWLSSIILEKLLRSVGVEPYSQALAHGISVALPAVLSFLLYKFVAFRETGNGKD